MLTKTTYNLFHRPSLLFRASFSGKRKTLVANNTIATWGQGIPLTHFLAWLPLWLLTSLTSRSPSKKKPVLCLTTVRGLLSQISLSNRLCVQLPPVTVAGQTTKTGQASSRKHQISLSQGSKAAKPLTVLRWCCVVALRSTLTIWSTNLRETPCYRTKLCPTPVPGAFKDSNHQNVDKKPNRVSRLQPRKRRPTKVGSRVSSREPTVPEQGCFISCSQGHNGTEDLRMEEKMWTCWILPPGSIVNMYIAQY